MITLPIVDGVIIGKIPDDALRISCTATVATIYQPGDELPAIEPPPAESVGYKEEADAKADADFAAYKARGGAPSYKAATFKIAAEKLGLLEAIEAAIMGLVNQASDKSLYVWWSETPAISRGDAEWQQIEPAVAWGKSSADELFALAAQI